MHGFLPYGAVSVDMPSATLTDQSYDFVESIFENVPSDDSACAIGLRGTLDHLASLMLPVSQDRPSLAGTEATY
jgi:hypothetical protein